jgi:hypothetical protein
MENIMQSFSQFISERYITTTDPDLKRKHADDVHTMLRNSYKSVDGYGGLGSGSKEEHEAIHKDLHDPHVIMKLHKKEGKALSVSLYKKQRGRKLIAAGTNGTDEGKASLHRIVKDDNKDKRAWGEVSHSMEKVYDKHKMPTVSSDKAEELTGKKIIRKHGDDHYDRLIGGHERTKVIKGHPDGHGARYD